MSLQPLLVDASALAAVIFLEDEGRPLAEMLDRRALHAPTLLPYELASVARKKLRQSPDDATVALVERGLALAQRRALHLHAVPPAAALAFAEQTGLSVYDAAYGWLSRHLGLPLITLDRRLAAALDRPC